MSSATSQSVFAIGRDGDERGCQQVSNCLGSCSDDRGDLNHSRYAHIFWSHVYRCAGNNACTSGSTEVWTVGKIRIRA
jgi:hypothetical protein